MAVEIERKFLIDAEKLPPLHGGVRIVQGYLSEHPHVRFRFAEDRVIIAIKRFRSAGERFEMEFHRDDATEEERAELVAMALYPPLAKTRYRIPLGGRVWEVDVYAGANAGLVTAEIELPALDTPIEFPDWTSPDREITHDSRYANIALTKSPFSEWK
jgi:adenylate cyclase